MVDLAPELENTQMKRRWDFNARDPVVLLHPFETPRKLLCGCVPDSCEYEHLSTVVNCE